MDENGQYYFQSNPNETPVLVSSKSATLWNLFIASILRLQLIIFCYAGIPTAVPTSNSNQTTTYVAMQPQNNQNQTIQTVQDVSAYT